MENWKKYEFSDCLVENDVGRSNQINASEIKKDGRFPVIDQGQDFIAGYSDEEDKLVKNGLPYVIFGDHTRCFKFVNFPFIIGADGTKVLSPNKELFEPKFFYYQLLSFNIPSRGYNRHYKLLKEKIVLKPEFPEQCKIAYVLTTIQKAIEQQDKIIRTTTELKKSLMQKLFTEGTKGEKQKQTEIGLVPESWESHTISEIGNVITGSTPSTKIVEYYNGEYNLISPADLGDEKYVTTSHKTMTRLGFEQCRKLPKDSVLVGCIGNIGKIGLVNNENCASNQQINAIVCNSSFNSHFVFYLLLFHQKVLESKASKVTIPILNKSNFESIVFYFPPYEIQNDIARILSSVDIKISHFKKKKQILTDLFKTLLHELITGQRRVHNISFVSL